MNNLITNEYLEHFRLRSARHKKRMQHEDFEKKLLALSREEHRLSRQQYELGWIELEKPIIRGWKRYFVLIEDVTRSKQKAFFENLLQKINTTQYSSRKDFKVKTRKYGKKIHVERKQEVIKPDKDFVRKHRFSEKELSYFEERMFYGKWQKAPVSRFVFMDSWRFVLRTRPNVITHVRARDVELEQRIKRIENFIERNHLRPKIHHLKHGSYKWRYAEEEKEKEKSPLRNKSLSQILDECKDAEVESYMLLDDDPIISSFISHHS